MLPEILWNVTELKEGKRIYEKHLSAIITSIGIMIGIILLILIQVIGKTNILDILVRCYAFSIPLWITIIVSLKEKKSSTAILKTTTRPTVVCSRL